MPSIKQLKTEISNAGYFNPQQKQWLLRGIEKAEHNMAQERRAPEYKIRPPKKSKGLMTLPEWESINTPLRTALLVTWMVKNNLSRDIMVEMVDEFRGEMLAKGKQYSNFVMAFQTYLRKGYLSKPMASCVLKTTTQIDTKGVNL